MTDREIQLAKMARRIFEQSREIEREVRNLCAMLEQLNISDEMRENLSKLKRTVSCSCDEAQELYRLHGSGELHEKER